MIVKKDNVNFYADKDGKPDVLLYAPQNHLELYDYIIAHKIKKIALCGGGIPTQEYLKTIVDFQWIEYINGYMKGLDFSFLNQMPCLKTYIGTVDFEIRNNSVEELYIGCTTRTKISKSCSNVKIIEIEACKSVTKLFNNGYPPSLRSLSFIKGSTESCREFIPNSTIEELSFIYCSKLHSLENLVNFTGLKKLSLENCRNLSDLNEISMVPSLKEVLIRNCPKIDVNKQTYSTGLKILVY